MDLTETEDIKKKWANLTQMTTISTTVGRNPLGEMEEPS